MKIVVCMGFYDSFNPSLYDAKNALTRKYLRWCRQLTDISFVFCGSEGAKSKQVVLDEGFDEMSYIEFDQGPHAGKTKVIEKKYEFLFKRALELHPDADIFMATGSSDFIPKKTFEALAYNYSDAEPVYYELQRITEGGILCIKTNALYSYDYSVIQSADHYYTGQNLGGMYACNRACLQKMKRPITLKAGDENDFINQCVKVGAKRVTVGNFFINAKVHGCETHPAEECQEIFKKCIENSKEALDFSELIDNL